MKPEYIDITNATHWIPEKNKTGNNDTDITINKHYRIYYDSKNNEYYIIDDNNRQSLVYLWQNGRYIIVTDKLHVN